MRRGKGTKSEGQEASNALKTGDYDYARLVKAAAGKSLQQGGLNKPDVKEILRLNEVDSSGNLDELRTRLTALLPTLASEDEDGGAASADHQHSRHKLAHPQTDEQYIEDKQSKAERKEASTA